MSQPAITESVLVSRDLLERILGWERLAVEPDLCPEFAELRSVLGLPQYDADADPDLAHYDEVTA